MYVVPFGGRKADKPSGPEAVTNAIITDCQHQIAPLSRLTAVTTFGVRKGQPCKHVNRRHLARPAPEWPKATVQIKHALVFRRRGYAGLEDFRHVAVHRRWTQRAMSFV